MDFHMSTSSRGQGAPSSRPYWPAMSPMPQRLDHLASGDAEKIARVKQRTFACLWAAAWRRALPQPERRSPCWRPRREQMSRMTRPQRASSCREFGEPAEQRSRPLSRRPTPHFSGIVRPTFLALNFPRTRRCTRPANCRGPGRPADAIPSTSAGPAPGDSGARFVERPR
jgi:hypothetical protein